MPRFNTSQMHPYQILKRTSDISDSPMGIGLNGGSVKRFLFTLLTKQADILFAEEAARLSVEQVLTFFSNDSPRDDLWVRMTLLLERSQSQSRRRSVERVQNCSDELPNHRGHSRIRQSEMLEFC